MSVRGFQSDIVDNWSLGVITSILADRLPLSAVPVCKNGQFYYIGPDKAVFGTRTGCNVHNETALSSRAVGQYCLKSLSSNTHLLALGDGDLISLTTGTPTVIGNNIFTEVDNPFSWQTANTLAYVVNGVDKFKTDGVDYWKFGIDQPVDADWGISAVAGAGTLPADTYDVVIAYYNSSHDILGPVSEVKTITITAGQKIRVAVPSDATIGDNQVDYVQIFIRAQSLSNEFFLVAAGTSPAIDGVNGWETGAVGFNVDMEPSSAQLLAFTILAPDVNDNYGPPSGTKFIINHKNRLFAFTSADVYWSEVDEVENFNLETRILPVGTDRGDPITGCAVLDDTLIIFKSTKVFVLFGDDPQTWVIKQIDTTTGCTGYNSIGTFDGKLFWMSFKGPQMWNGVSSGISDITTQLIGPNFDSAHISPEDLANSVILGNTNSDYVAWAITPVGETANTLIIPFDYKLERWMATEWNMIDVCSSAQVVDATGRAWPVIADYDGFVYTLGSSYQDGIPTGIRTTGTVSSATSTTLVDNTQTWTKSLVGRYIYVWNDAQGIDNAQRRKITANTSTEITVDAWDNTPSAADNYIIGGVFFDWRTGFHNGSSDGTGGFYKKRIEFVFLEVASESGGVDYNVQVYTDMDTENPLFDRQLTLGESAIFDVDYFDESYFAGTSKEINRLPVRRVGYSWQTRISHMGNGEILYIYRTGVEWLTKTKKPGNG